MIRPTQSQIAERFNGLPEELKSMALSDEAGDLLWLIGEAHHLNEERLRKLAAVTSYVLLGFIHSEGLAKEITIEVAIDRRLADEIAHEIKFKILSPIIPQLQQLYHYGPAGAPQATPTIVPSQPQKMRPTFAPGQEAGSRKQEVEEEQPFVLREESEEPERVRPRDETLVRPSFYDPSAGSGQAGPGLRQGYGGQGREAGIERSVARLEIPSMDSASSPQASLKEPQVGKTEEPEIRVVHYSGPQTPVDPFAPQQMANGEEQMAEPQQPPKDIHPENVVDLKDLPK